MSIHVMNLVWKKSRNKRTAMLLLLAIADHAHDDGTGTRVLMRTLIWATLIVAGLMFLLKGCS